MIDAHNERYLNRHIAMVVITMECLDGMFRQGWNTEGKILRCVQGMPPDATFVGMVPLDDLSVGFLYYHPSFQPVLYVSPFPRYCLTYEYTLLEQSPTVTSG